MSVISRVHFAPTATANGWLEVYGARPLSVVPSEQLRIQPIQPTSLGSTPLEQVIAEEMVGDDGGEGCEGGGDGGEGGGGDGGGGAMHFLMTVSQLQSPLHQLAPLFVLSIVPSLSVKGHRAQVFALCPPQSTDGDDGGDCGNGGEGGGNGGEGGGEGGGCGWNCTTKDLVP